jgi:uncharacterized protein DUF6510
MDELMLDGNAAAALLYDVFGTEMTAVRGTCVGCGAVEALGAVHVFRSAGTVFRCAHCDAVLMTIVTAETRMWLDLRGLRALELRTG